MKNATDAKDICCGLMTKVHCRQMFAVTRQPNVVRRNVCPLAVFLFSFPSSLHMPPPKSHMEKKFGRGRSCFCFFSFFSFCCCCCFVSQMSEVADCFSLGFVMVRTSPVLFTSQFGGVSVSDLWSVSRSDAFSSPSLRSLFCAGNRRSRWWILHLRQPVSHSHHNSVLKEMGQLRTACSVSAWG